MSSPSATELRSCDFLRVLPTALLERVGAFLLGVELFALSHTSSDALQVFSRDHLWVSRVGALSIDRLHDSELGTAAAACHVVSSKQRYARECRSFLFPGHTCQDATGDFAGAFIPLRRQMRDVFGSWGNPFSFEMWFSLSLDDDSIVSTCTPGGVLLGAQSALLTVEPNSSFRPDSFADLVFVDSQRNLYCSALNALAPDDPVTLALEPGRWYHLALVYTHQRERVYLDGELLRTEIGRLPAKWRSLYAAQVGIGLVGGHLIGSPSQGDSWHGFRGVVDSFRTYRFSLSHDAIRRLSNGASVDEHSDFGDTTGYHGKLIDNASFCLQRDVGARSSVQRVLCSRPRERWCRAMPAPVRDTDTLDDLVDAI